jgi:hypothetical protein
MDVSGINPVAMDQGTQPLVTVRSYVGLDMPSLRAGRVAPAILVSLRGLPYILVQVHAGTTVPAMLDKCSTERYRSSQVRTRYALGGQPW